MTEQPPLEMTAGDVLEIHELLHANGIRIWIDGGWAVDALLGTRTRRHRDLDFVIERRNVPTMRELLAVRGFREKGEWYARPWNYVLVDDDRHELDLHIIELDPLGDGIYGDDHGESYTAHALSGHGTIDGRAVHCIAAEDLVRFHSGYELTEKDFHDVSALCTAFGLELPEDFRPFLTEAD